MHLKFIFMGVTMVRKEQVLMFVSKVGGICRTSNDLLLSARVEEDRVSIGEDVGPKEGVGELASTPQRLSLLCNNWRSQP